MIFDYDVHLIIFNRSPMIYIYNQKSLPDSRQYNSSYIQYYVCYKTIEEHKQTGKQENDRDQQESDSYYTDTVLPFLFIKYSVYGTVCV